MTNQFCMLCGGEWTEEIPCTCPADGNIDPDRYILLGIAARLDEIPMATPAQREVIIEEIRVNLNRYLSE